MHRPKSGIDEYTLAGFLSNTLPREKRAAVLAHLIQDTRGRELICMANEALQSLREPDSGAIPPRRSKKPLPSSRKGI